MFFYQLDEPTGAADAGSPTPLEKKLAALSQRLIEEHPDPVRRADIVSRYTAFIDIGALFAGSAASVVACTLLRWLRRTRFEFLGHLNHGLSPEEQKILFTKAVVRGVVYFDKEPQGSGEDQQIVDVTKLLLVKNIDESSLDDLKNANKHKWKCVPKAVPIEDNDTGKPVHGASLVTLAGQDHQKIAEAMGFLDPEQMAFRNLNVYDQAHTIGIDLPNAIDSRGLVTTKVDTVDAEYSQAEMRMRGVSPVNPLFPQFTDFVVDGASQVKLIEEIVRKAKAYDSPTPELKSALELLGIMQK